MGMGTHTPTVSQRVQPPVDVEFTVRIHCGQHAIFWIFQLIKRNKIHNNHIHNYANAKWIDTS